jgi:hypothetical protein
METSEGLRGVYQALGGLGGEKNDAVRCQQAQKK